VAPSVNRQGPFLILPAPQPRDIAVRVSGLIATLPRSGSWLLADSLEATERVGQPAEFFRPDYLGHYRKAWGLRADASMPEYVAAALDRTASTQGVFTAKLHWYQFDWLTSCFDQDGSAPESVPTDLISDVFPGLRFVYLTRDDRSRQALSYYVATKSQDWFESDATAGRLTDDPDWAPDLQQVRFFEDAITRHETSWERVLGTTSCPVHQLSYEDLVADRQASVEAVLTFLEVEGAAEVVVPPPRIARQAGAFTDQWVERYNLLRDDLAPLTSDHVWSKAERAYIDPSAG
jgi:trehalose 2-sulfotransferase